MIWDVLLQFHKFIIFVIDIIIIKITAWIYRAPVRKPEDTLHRRINAS